jgi:hypothetical protein
MLRDAPKLSSRDVNELQRYGKLSSRRRLVNLLPSQSPKLSNPLLNLIQLAFHALQVLQQRPAFSNTSLLSHLTVNKREANHGNLSKPKSVDQIRVQRDFCATDEKLQKNGEVKNTGGDDQSSSGGCAWETENEEDQADEMGNTSEDESDDFCGVDSWVVFDSRAEDLDQGAGEDDGVEGED